MKYFFVSDIHGEYDKLVVALANANFDMENDTIVSLGDAFDRGAKSKEVLEFLMACPHRILVWGNHDARLSEVLLRGGQDHYDNANGMRETFKSLCGGETLPSIYWGIQTLKSPEHDEVRKLLYRYFDECVWAIEFDNLIACHAWLPTIALWGKKENVDGLVMIDADIIPNWRNCDSQEWYDAAWTNTDNMVFAFKAFPSKPLIVGHWFAWHIAYHAGDETRFTYMGKDTKLTDTSAFTLVGNNHPNITFIDGYSNAPEGQINVVVFESDEVPLTYDGRRKVRD